ncbi:cell wall-binding repeat-containing protein [Euzebya sp.]|uniref:cell wall-binding repeat-containing protein n=1 Tax=Euzebya sp. TaxID=1971409 RepID=UPI0035184864
MRTSPSSARAPRSVVAAVAALATLIALVLLAVPADAGQGAPPTTDLTGYVEAEPPALPPTFSQGCLPAGGSPIANPDPPDADFAFVGGGWGHGAGMSQYGAQGAGMLGCTAEQILTTYFPGTNVATVAIPPQIVIGLATGITSTRVTADAGPVPWELCHYQTGACQPLPVEQPTGAVWTITILPDARYRITDAGGAAVFEGGDYELNLRARLSQTDADTRRVSLSETGHVYRWGTLQMDSVQTASSNAYMTLEIPDMDLYLRGLSEVPASWPAPTLQAQAIAGRSYAVRRIQALGIRDSCRCNLLATPADQNYEGYDYERADAQIGGRWRAAVEATSRQVLLHQGAVAETFYSSSHGGHSESSRFVFGGDLPYVQPVDDSRWDLASNNPLRRWTATFTAAELGAAAGVGQATQVEFLEPRGAAGRVGNPARGYGGVRVTGTGGQAVLSGDQLRQRLGMRSTLFGLTADSQQGPPPTDPSPPPPPPSEPPDETPDLLARAAASNRIATAVAVSGEGWDTAADVVVAAADRFPDALAGVKLAASLSAPLLLTYGDGLDPSVAAEIDRLGAETAWLLGGASALSSGVRGDLADLGLVTRRLSGDTRYHTAADIATASAVAADEVTVALGDDWPDAVSASSLAALVDGPPTLLVQRDRVPGPTVAAINQLGARRVTVVGGTAVIGQAVVAQLEDLGLEVTRLAGGDRFATSTAVASSALERRTGAVPLVVASGSGFPDALSAGALAARLGGVLVLAPSTSLPSGSPVSAFVAAHASRLDGGVVVGGTGVISTAVERQLESLLDGG